MKNLFYMFLTEQKQALQTDIGKMVEEIEKVELDLESKRDAKNLAYRELRSIEKKLEKLRLGN